VARSDADGWPSDALVGRRGTCVVESDLAAAARSCASQDGIGGARLPEMTAEIPQWQQGRESWSGQIGRRRLGF
jgi:hypothetical protein